MLFIYIDYTLTLTVTFMNTEYIYAETLSKFDNINYQY